MSAYKTVLQVILNVQVMYNKVKRYNASDEQEDTYNVCFFTRYYKTIGVYKTVGCENECRTVLLFFSQNIAIN